MLVSKKSNRRKYDRGADTDDAGKDEAMKLKGKNAIVVGGGRNAGRAVCVGLAREGANVAVVVRSNKDEAEETAKLVRSMGGKSAVILADARSLNDVLRAVEEANGALGFIDILAYTIGFRPVISFLDLTPEVWREVFATNVDGAFYFARAVLPQMVEKKRGCIINVTGTSAYQGRGFQKVHVGASKGALRALTHGLAAEFGQYGIRINSVAPTAIKWQTSSEYLKRVPLGRWGKPEEVAAAVVFLATEDASFITGQAIHVNGGFLMS